jgi:hypothetical protein
LLLTIKRNVYVSLKYADPSKISNFKRKNWKEKEILWINMEVTTL